MTKGTIAERAEKFDALLERVLPKIAASPIVIGGKTSAVEAMLRNREAEILDLLSRGVAPGTLARLIHDADDAEESFAQESIRLAIVRLARSANGVHPKPSASDGTRRRAAPSPPPSKSRTTTNDVVVPAKKPTMAPSSAAPISNHNGFEEDPT